MLVQTKYMQAVHAQLNAIVPLERPAEEKVGKNLRTKEKETTDLYAPGLVGLYQHPSGVMSLFTEACGGVCACVQERDGVREKDASCWCWCAKALGSSSVVCVRACVRARVCVCVWGGIP